MAVPWQVMNKIRSKIRQVANPPDTIKASVAGRGISVGDKIKTDDFLVDQKFYTFDYDSKQIVSNFKFNGFHYIFDLQGNLIKQHRD